MMPSVARGQNWSLVIRDLGAGTAINQVNGTAGGTATLYASLFNFTGISLSNDGFGSPAPATSLDFAGFGWTLSPGQFDLESVFLSAPGIPGEPRVSGSLDGSTPGSSGYISLGTFNLLGLAPGTYEEDFTVGAFTTDPDSAVAFEDIRGTLRLNVTAASGVAAEPGTASLLLLLGGFFPRRVLGQYLENKRTR